MRVPYKGMFKTIFYQYGLKLKNKKLKKLKKKQNPNETEV